MSTRENLHKGTFPGSILTDEREYLAWLHLEVNASERVRRPKPFRDAVHFQTKSSGHFHHRGHREHVEEENKTDKLRFVHEIVT